MANRWNEDDSDRLPEGMRRVGYDSDTQQYTFQDDTGLWVGEPGTEYGGEMQYIGPATAPVRSESPQEPEPSSSSYRILLPFFLIISVFLLLIFRLVSTNPSPPPSPRSCPSGTNPHTVVRGDTCWDLAVKFGLTVDDVEKMNPSLDCAHLVVGEVICH